MYRHLHRQLLRVLRRRPEPGRDVIHCSDCGRPISVSAPIFKLNGSSIDVPQLDL